MALLREFNTIYSVKISYRGQKVGNRSIPFNLSAANRDILQLPPESDLQTKMHDALLWVICQRSREINKLLKYNFLSLCIIFGKGITLLFHDV